MPAANAMTTQPPAPRYTVGTISPGAKNHAICDGPIVVAIVHGNGYPAGQGWHPQSEALARRIVEFLNSTPENAPCS